MARRNVRRQTSKSRPGRLRIVAGKWRSRVLPIVEGDTLRPTPERVRETLFNWLAPRIEGARCLDAFAGTGALGFEALSRGASRVVFLETDREASRTLEQNRELLAADGADILGDDAYRYLAAESRDTFDIVFLDPPFKDDRAAELCRLLDKGGLLAPGAMVYLEEPRERPPTDLPESWVIKKQKAAGNVRYSLIAAAR